jgi:hypothetical protein
MLLCLVRSMMRVRLVGSLLGVVVPIAMLVWVTMGACVPHVDYIFTHEHNENQNITRHIRFSKK